MGGAQRKRGQEQSAKIQEPKQNFPLPLRKKCLKNKQDKNHSSLEKFTHVCHQAGVPILCLPDLPAPLPARDLGVPEARL